MFLFTQRVYPDVDGTWDDSFRRRIADVMFRPNANADVRTGVLITLAHHADLLKPNFAPDQLKQHHRRIEELAKGEHLVAGATQAMIEAIQAVILAATLISVIVASTMT